MGGDLGQAIVKALRLSRRPVTALGCDANPDSAGSLFVDLFFEVPTAGESARYIDALDRLCAAHVVDAVIPASEAEIRVLAPVGRLPCGTAVVSQAAGWAGEFGDKLKCMRHLEGKVALAPFADGHDPDELSALVQAAGFPLVVKGRFSSGSRTLRIAATSAQLAHAVQDVPSPLVQAYIDDAFGEYSAGVFVCDEFSASILFARELGFGGTTRFASVVEDEELTAYLGAVAKAADGHGAFNIQLRKSGLGPRLLEINPRFSSLAAARAYCGFRDVEWSLALALGRTMEPPPVRFPAVRFQRFLSEAVDVGEGFGVLPEWAPRSSQVSGAT